MWGRHVYSLIFILAYIPELLIDLGLLFMTIPWLQELDLDLPQLFVMGLSYCPFQYCVSFCDDIFYYCDVI